MRKIIVFLLLFITTAVMAASVKVVAKYKKGDYCIYQVTQTSMSSTEMGQGTNLSFVGEIRYDVTDVRPDGYTLEAKTLKWEKANPEGLGGEESIEDLTTELSMMSLKMMEGIPVVLKTDLEGKVLQFVNYDEIKSKVNEFAEELIDKLFAQGGEAMAGVLNKDNMKQMMVDEIREDRLLENMNSNYLGMYGKTIATGMMEDENFVGMKFKTTYLVPSSSNADGYTIKASSVSSMTKEDLKDMIIKQVEKLMPADQVDMVKENIDMIIQSGSIKMEGTKQASYEFLNSGWLKSSEFNIKMNMMGTETTSVTKTTIKECSWK